MKAVADRALERETGARGLRSIIEEILLEVQFELPSRRDVKKCVVTKETVERGVKPTLVTEGRPKRRRLRPPSQPDRVNRTHPCRGQGAGHMRWWVIVAAMLAVAVVLGGSRAVVAQQGGESDCMNFPLGAVPAYSVITRADFQQESGDQRDGVVVGGNADFKYGSIGNDLPLNPVRVDLAVAGNLVATYPGLNKGSATYGGTLTPPDWKPSNGTVTKAAPPFDVAALFDGLVVRSASWATLEAKDPINGSFDGEVALRGTNADRNVFKMSRSWLAGAKVITIDVPAGSTTLVNLTDEGEYSAAQPAGREVHQRRQPANDLVELLRGHEPQAGGRLGVVAGHDPGAVRDRSTAGLPMFTARSS